MDKKEAKERTDTSLAQRATQSRAGRIAIKAAGWVVAVPALLALVVIGGAAPIYLLLPEAPVAEDGPPPAAVQIASTVPAAQPPAVGARSGEAPQSVDAGESPSESAPPLETRVEAVDVAPMRAEEDSDSAPPVEMVDEPDLAAIVVPTARPQRAVADGGGTSTSAATTAAPQKPRRMMPTAEPVPAQRQQASRPTRRFVTIRPVALRSAPGGREVAMLGRGAEVLAGSCDDWCEVSSGGVRGWIHPSFLSASAPRERARRPAPRTIDPYDDEPILLQQTRRYDRRREAVPDWMLDDDRPIEFYDYDGRR